MQCVITYRKDQIIVLEVSVLVEARRRVAYVT